LFFKNHINALLKASVGLVFQKSYPNSQIIKA